jgi:exodeoxyribonuclease VII small subunit
MLEEDIKRLDELTRQMEKGELPLDRSLELFQEGIELVRRCQKILESSELRVKEILAQNGSLEEKAL